MKPALRFERVAIEALVAAAVGAAVVAALYSNWWSSCCKATLNLVVSIPLFPGMFVAMLIGGGPHGAQRYHVYIGVAAEFFALWIIFRLFIAPRFSRRPSNDV